MSDGYKGTSLTHFWVQVWVEDVFKRIYDFWCFTINRYLLNLLITIFLTVQSIVVIILGGVQNVDMKKSHKDNPEAYISKLSHTETGNLKCLCLALLDFPCLLLIHGQQN